MMVIFERALQGGGGQFHVGHECVRRMKDPLLRNEMSRDEQHLAELYMLGYEKMAMTARGVQKTGKAAKGVPKTGRAAKGVPNTGRKAKGVPNTGRKAKGVLKGGEAALGVKKGGGGASGVKKGPLQAPRRCNICSWFQQREIIKGKGHVCPEVAKEAAKEAKMTQMQLRRAVIKLLKK